MNILALDLGTKCGWATDIQSGVWNLKPSTHESAGERYHKFRIYLADIFDTLNIDYVVYEKVHAHRGVEAAHVYGGLMAVLQLACIEHNKEYRGIGVQTIKKYATGKSNASKDEMIKAAICTYKSVNVVDDNHADALHLLAYAKTIFSSTRQPSGPESMPELFL